MCGIIGYVGGSDVANTVVEGMKRLEYRGYDSYGFCAFRNNSHFLYKDIGIVSQNPRLAGIVHTLNGDFISGIGHTRWATHGEPFFILLKLIVKIDMLLNFLHQLFR